MTLFSFFKKKKDTREVDSIAREKLAANKSVLESLRAYDQGEKEISTAGVEKRLQDIRTTP